MFQKIVDNPFVYKPVSKMENNYRNVIWKRFYEKNNIYGELILIGPDRLTEETLSFNSDTTAILKFNYIEKDNHFTWKYLLNIYDFSDMDTFIFRNDTLFFMFDISLVDIGVFKFENDTLKLEQSPSIFVL